MAHTNISGLRLPTSSEKIRLGSRTSEVVHSLQSGAAFFIEKGADICGSILHFSAVSAIVSVNIKLGYIKRDTHQNSCALVAMEPLYPSFDVHICNLFLSCKSQHGPSKGMSALSLSP